MRSSEPALCCGQSGARSVLWFRSLPEAEQLKVADADSLGLDDVPAIMWGTAEDVRASDSAVAVFAGPLHGQGIRVIVEGCNRRWRRPIASALCAECGRGQTLGYPPRGWPKGRRRWYVWFDRYRLTVGGIYCASTRMQGTVVLGAVQGTYARDVHGTITRTDR